MRKFLLTAALAQGAALALFVGACKAPDGADAGRSAGAAQTASTPAANTAQPNQPAPQSPANVVRRVTPAEVKGMLDRGEAVVVDVRPKAEFDRERIKGALSIPLNESAARASELPKDKLVVFYCA